MADSTPNSTTAGANTEPKLAAESTTESSESKSLDKNSRLVHDETIDVPDEVEKELDDDELLEELENDDYGMSSFREQRIEELKEEAEKRRLMMEYQHGSYKDVTDEKEILDITTKTKHSVVHFYHSDFRRCMIVDKHLESLAKKHIKTKFVKIKVEDAPFLVEKLQVKVLPCVIAFTDGLVVDRLVGFDELGNTDNFPTAMLELRYKTTGVIEDDSKKKNQKQTQKSIYSRDYGSDEDSDE
ncbi:hypothetical protein BGZ76_003732 [Entomortierella beljakovae]|nr:hypothetical protein BGZ76_003732 [Entomortierella beljakovae]